MPVYVFTYHAYMSWLPDRRQGYVEKGKGIQPPDHRKADFYRRNATDSPIEFGEPIQRILIDATIAAAEHQQFDIHMLSCEPTHFHALISWRDSRGFEKVRTSLRESLSRALNSRLGRRKWLAEGASRKRIRDRDHLDFHLTQYLPKHRGLKYTPQRGIFV